MPNENISRPLPPWAHIPRDTVARKVAKRLHGLARRGQCRHHPREPHHHWGHHHTVPREDRIKVVCISDTHTATPHVPPADIFLHAGDLTNFGSFVELQAQIDWIRSLPHKHKVVIAGNHDLLLDGAFVERHPVRELGRFDRTPGRTKEDLVWGDVIYLEDEELVLTVELGVDSGASVATSEGEKAWQCKEQEARRGLESSSSGISGSPRTRQVRIYGTPHTPASGQRAFGFQYDPAEEDMWIDKIPPDTDILLTHGPPKFHLDLFLGCHHLLRDIWRARPGVVVFGHIHSGHGEKLMVYDSVQHWYEKILSGRENLGTLFMLASHTIMTQIGRFFPRSKLDNMSQTKRQSTRLINAAHRAGRVVYEAPVFEI
jgi:hypothetical protein